MFLSIFGITLLTSLGSTQQIDCTGIKAINPRCHNADSTPYTRDFFYVGGRPVNISSGQISSDKLYVEKIAPLVSNQSKPIVFSHGGGCSGTTWLNTPDNRKGFAAYFLEKGYTVYIIDAASLGRSASSNFNEFPLIPEASSEIVEQGFTGVKHYNTYPQSQFHTQWPGTGRAGDPVFEEFKKSMTPYTSNSTAFETALRTSGCTLLDLIGPSYLISHSAGAATNMLLSNDCPQNVAANINLEGSTTPFIWYTSVTGTVPKRLWGLADTHLDYDPPISSPSELVTESIGNSTIALRNCIQQVEPARKLPNIAKVPYLMVTGEASVHMTYDHCIINYLKQVGADPEWIKLGEIGIKGNAHFMHLEKNNGEIAGVVLDWIAEREKN